MASIPPSSRSPRCRLLRRGKDTLGGRRRSSRGDDADAETGGDAFQPLGVGGSGMAIGDGRDETVETSVGDDQPSGRASGLDHDRVRHARLGQRPLPLIEADGAVADVKTECSVEYEESLAFDQVDVPWGLGSGGAPHLDQPEAGDLPGAVDNGGVGQESQNFGRPR